MGAPRISYASPPYSGALALKLAVEKLDGKDVPKLTILPLPIVTNDTIKLCQEGTWKEMKDGCNAFPPSIVTNPGWFASIFSRGDAGDRPQAALVGQPETLIGLDLAGRRPSPRRFAGFAHPVRRSVGGGEMAEPSGAPAVSVRRPA